MVRNLSGLILAVVVLAACSTAPMTRWERPGASDATSARDASDCSAVSWTEAERLHPYGATAATSSATVDSDWMIRRQQVDNARFSDANRFFALCMQSRGYSRVDAHRR